MQAVKLVSLKFGSQADVAVIGLTDEPKIWLTIAFSLIYLVLKVQKALLTGFSLLSWFLR